MGICQASQTTRNNSTLKGVLKTEKTNGLSTKATENPLSKNITRKTSKYIDDEKEIVINSNIFVSKADGLPNENYSMCKRLGEGSYGVVWKVKHKLTSFDRAMKKIIKNPKTKKETETEILNEIEILKQMDHPGIVKIFEFYNTPDGYFLITDFCDGGELFQEIIEKAPFSETVSAHIMYQLFSAVNYCHSSGIIHRDLKPENILIDSKDELGYYNIKVIDFGTAKLYEKNKSEKKVIGSSYYIAPEVLKKDYTEKCDLWSCGVIMYILLSGRAPFSGDKDSIILEKIKIGKYDLKKAPFNRVSSDAKDLIKKLLESNPKNRHSAAQALKHSWFKKLDVKRQLCEVDETFLKATVENLKNYNPEHKLQQVVLAYLVHNFPQFDDIKEINRIFQKFDENSDGKLTKEEFQKGLTKYLGNNKQEQLNKDAEEIFKRIDNDMSGFVSFEEFVRAAIDKSIFLEENTLKFAFSFFDKDDSGEITIDELKAIFCIDGDMVYTENLLKNIMKGIDTDGNGEISFPEFKAMMEKILI